MLWRTPATSRIRRRKQWWLTLVTRQSSILGMQAANVVLYYIPLSLRFCPSWPFVIVSALVAIRAVPCEVVLADLHWVASACSVAAQRTDSNPLKERCTAHHGRHFSHIMRELTVFPISTGSMHVIATEHPATHAVECQLRRYAVRYSK